MTSQEALKIARRPCSHYIKRADGKLYRGSVYGTDADWTDSKWDAFPYSENVAHQKIANFPVFFKNCEVAL